MVGLNAVLVSSKEKLLVEPYCSRYTTYSDIE